MTCPQCQAQNPADARFCPACGSVQGRSCPGCAAIHPSHFRFCPDCGSELSAETNGTSPEPSPQATSSPIQRSSLPSRLSPDFYSLMEESPGENRFLTVMFADMSRSLETTNALHPEDAASHVNRLLETMVETVLRYEGRIDRFLGDGALAVFGMPIAHEDDPKRALLAAWEIRERARSQGFEVTFGINTGETYIGVIGSEQHREVTVMGPTVNLAARLQGMSKPGQILMGEMTRRHVRHAFALSPVSLSIKGVKEPITAYEAMHPLAQPGSSRGLEGLEAPLIGRDQELATLQEALTRTMQGQGGIVSLIGEAGMGKSRLVSEFKRHTFRQENSPLWLEGRCLEHSASESYIPFLDLLRNLLRPSAVQDGERLQSLEKTLREMSEKGGITEAQVRRMGPVLGNLLSLREYAEEERLREMPPEQVKRETFLAVRDLLLALARERPLIILFEDLHWADGLSLELLSFLLESMGNDSPLMLLCVYRPERDHPCMALDAKGKENLDLHSARIEIQELSPGQSEELIHSLLQIARLPDSVIQLIREKAGGNPFYVEEVIRSLIEAGMIFRDDVSENPTKEVLKVGTPGEEIAGGSRLPIWSAAEEAELLAVPESIQSVLLSRMDRLDAESKKILQVACAIGPCFSGRLLERAVPEKIDLSRALLYLESRQLIRRDASESEGNYIFRHVLIQETAYGTILRRHRAHLHGRIGQALEELNGDRLEEVCGELAHHYSLSTRVSKAVTYLVKSGERAKGLYANPEAIRYFERALGLIRELPSPDGGEGERLELEIGIRESLGDVLFTSGAHRKAEHHFEHASRLAARLESAIRWRTLTCKRADAVHWQGDYDRSIQIALEAWEGVEQAGRSREAACLLELLSRSHWAKADYSPARRYALQAARIVEEIPYFEAGYQIYYCLAWLDILEGDSESAGRWLKKLEGVCREHHNDKGLARCYHGLGDLARDRNDLVGASEWFQKSLAHSERFFDAHFLLEGHLELAHVLILLGRDAADIDAHIKTGMALAEEMAEVSPTSVAPFCRWLWEAFLQTGNADEAFRFFERFVKWGGSPPPFVLSSLLSKIEPISLQNGHHPAFLAFCRRAQEQIPEMCESSLSTWLLTPISGMSDDFQPSETVNFGTNAVEFPQLWRWIDPAGSSSSQHLAQYQALEVQAASGCTMFPTSLQSPRWLRPVSGEFIIQAHTVSLGEEGCQAGGPLLWKNAQNYLILGKRSSATNEVYLDRCLDGEYGPIGRGFLPGNELWLRLERKGNIVSAFAGSDGQEWFGCGETRFPVGENLEAGIFVACPDHVAASDMRFRTVTLFRHENDL